jgi:hypothetical protein
VEAEHSANSRSEECCRHASLDHARRAGRH